MRKAFSLMFCMLFIFLAQITCAGEKSEVTDAKIEELTKNFFYYSSGGTGKRSLVPISEPKEDWRSDRFEDGCEDTVVKLTRPDRAVAIPGTSLILAFLECPASRGFEYDSIVALFDRKDLSKPTCSSRLYLMSQRTELRYYYYGNINRLNVRKAGDRAFYIALRMSGADGGDYWTSIVFLHMDMDCNITILSKLYESYHCDGSCEGAEIEYRFINSKTVEAVRTEFEWSEDKGNKVVKKTRKRYDLAYLYTHPGSRVYPSETEKTLALLNSGADTDAKDNDGVTRLMSAAAEGASSLAETLVKKGADVNAKDNRKRTPLMIAAHKGDAEIARMLLENGADYKARDSIGWTVLMHAAAGKNLKVLFAGMVNGKLVLDYGETGGTLDVIKLLVEKGADVNAKAADGTTALSIAKNKGIRQVVEALKSLGAKE